jgi:hypothetical protein
MGPAAIRIKPAARCDNPVMRSPLRRIGTCIGFAGVLLAAASVAAPLAPTASRPEIKRWFAAVNVEAAAQQRWTYSFAAADGRMLEALSVALVRDGYEIVTLAGGAAPTLLMAKAELHSPTTLVQRNHALREMASRYGARYEGCDVLATSSRGR